MTLVSFCFVDIGTYLLRCFRYVLRWFIIQISDECRWKLMLYRVGNIPCTNPTLNLPDSVHKCKRDRKMHLLMQPYSRGSQFQSSPPPSLFVNTPDSDNQLVRSALRAWTVFRLTCSLHSVHCSLHRVHCSLHRVHCSLHRVHCSLHRVHCSLHRVHCSLHRVHCSLHSVHCSLQRVHCSLHRVHCPLHRIHCPLHRDHCPLHRVHCPLHRDHCPLHRIHCPLHRVHCPLHRDHCPLHRDHCPLHRVHCSLLPEQGNPLFTLFRNIHS